MVGPFRPWHPLDSAGAASGDSIRDGRSRLTHGDPVSGLNPIARVPDRVQGDVPHPALVPEARHAEPAGAHALVAPVEGAQALRAQVLLGLHLDGVHVGPCLHEEVDLAAGVLGRPVIGRKPAVRNELLADVLLGEGPLNSVKMPPPSTIADGLTPLIAPRSPMSNMNTLKAFWSR